MKNITELEKTARLLEPDAAFRASVTKKAGAYISRFISTLPETPGYQEGTCNRLRSMQIGEEGKPFDELLKILEDEVDTAGINSASGAHLGYIPGGGIWASSVADWLAAATNRYAGIAYSSPGAVAMENKLIRWLSSLAGYPATAHGNLTSGGSIANLTAIKTARDFHNISSENVKKSAVYLTEQTHHCIHKALNTTGLHEAVIRVIPVNSHFQMDPGALQKRLEADLSEGLKPFLVIGTAGTTDTGAVDPLDQIADLAQKHGLWFHVDAAYGGFFMLAPGQREKFRGIERSDSLVMDPHKTLFIPYGSGVVLVRDRRALVNSYSHKAAYMQDAYSAEELDPSDCGPELSKHFRGLRMWLPLHLHGLKPFRANLEEKILLCRYFHDEIRKMGFETGPEPQLSITLFRLPGDENNTANRRLMEALITDGRYFFSSTMIGEKLWIRCAVASFRTHLREIDGALQMIRERKFTRLKD